MILDTRIIITTCFTFWGQPVYFQKMLPDIVCFSDEYVGNMKAKMAIFKSGVCLIRQSDKLYMLVCYE